MKKRVLKERRKSKKCLFVQRGKTEEDLMITLILEISRERKGEKNKIVYLS